MSNVYLITGSASGIGAAVARTLADAGHGIACVDRDDTLDPPPGEHVMTVTADVADAERMESVAAEARARFGRLDGCVAAAGIEEPRTAAHELEPLTARRVLEVNVLGTLFTASAVARRLIADGRPGSIVLIGSILSTAAMPGLAAYSASKGAVAQLGRALAVDWGGHGIRVNTVAPSFVRTPMSAAGLADPQRAAYVAANTPLGRPAESSEIAAVVQFLLSEQAGYVTGALIEVDGGWKALA